MRMIEEIDRFFNDLGLELVQVSLDNIGRITREMYSDGTEFIFDEDCNLRKAFFPNNEILTFYDENGKFIKPESPKEENFNNITDKNLTVYSDGSVVLYDEYKNIMKITYSNGTVYFPVSGKLINPDGSIEIHGWFIFNSKDDKVTKC